MYKQLRIYTLKIWIDLNLSFQNSNLSNSAIQMSFLCLTVESVLKSDSVLDKNSSRIEKVIVPYLTYGKEIPYHHPRTKLVRACIYIHLLFRPYGSKNSVPITDVVIYTEDLSTYRPVITKSHLQTR